MFLFDILAPLTVLDLFSYFREEDLSKHQIKQVHLSLLWGNGKGFQ